MVFGKGRVAPRSCPLIFLVILAQHTLQANGGGTISANR